MRVGCDVARIERFEGKEDLARRLLSSRELEEYEACHDKATYLARAFAAKEAYVKATGRTKTDYRRLEVAHEEDGRPYLCLDGKRIDGDLSLSHDFVALAVLIVDERRNG